MRKAKKIISLVTALLVVIGIFSSCGVNKVPGDTNIEANENEPVDTNEPVPELTGLAATWPEFAKQHEVQILCTEQGWSGPEGDKDFVTPEISKRTNMLLKYESLTCANDDAYKQKLNLMAASSEVPEVFFGYPDAFSQNIYKTLGMNDLIWDISTMIKDYENIYSLIKPELIMYRDTETKANYSIPTQTGKGDGDPTGGVPGGIYIREDWLKKLNMSYPKNPDELYTYLKRCKDEIKTVGEKNVIPLTFDENLKRMEDKLLAPIFCPLNTYSDGNISYIDAFGLVADYKENKIVNYGYTDGPELMGAAKFINKLYLEGLLDKEVLTQKRTQYQEKISQGIVALHVAPYWDSQTFSDNAKAVVPDLMYVAMPSVNAPGVPKYTDAKYTNPVRGYSMITFSKKLDEETVRHFLATLDYLATKEGQLLVQYGIEGKSYNFGADGKIQFVEQYLKDTNDLDWNNQAAYGVQYWAQLVMNAGIIADITPIDPNIDKPDSKISIENRKILSETFDATMDPPKSYYLNAGDVETRKMPALTQAKLEMWAKVINAKSEADVETIVHEWAKSCKNIGIDEIIAEKQNFLDTFDISSQN